MHHYESLARMRDESGAIILPWAFETFGLITTLDKVILQKTLNFHVNLRKQGKQISFSVNLSGKDIGDLKLLEFVKSKLSETEIDPTFLIFEITETAAVRELDRAVKFVKDIRSLGCKISLDDFGVGFTSLHYLKELEVDYLKIDGSFVRKLPESKNDRLFVKSIVDVAKGMGIKTVAEFVETKEILEIIREYGVDYAQGYYIGKPSPDVLKG